MESTYGDRAHLPTDPEVLARVIRGTVRRGGVVLVPAFAVDRTEVVLAELERLRDAGRIPAVPVYLDSPMALAAIEVYRRALQEHHLDVRPGIENPLEAGDLIEAHSALESERLNRPGHPCVILSASGMATGGRVLHHLKHQLADSRNAVVLPGFQALGTRGRSLLEGARHVKIHGLYVPVRAEVVEVPYFSCHADAEEITRWLGQLPEAPHTTYVVHGEPAAADALATRLSSAYGWCAVPPRFGEKVLLG